VVRSIVACVSASIVLTLALTSVEDRALAVEVVGDDSMIEGVLRPASDDERVSVWPDWFQLKQTPKPRPSTGPGSGCSIGVASGDLCVGVRPIPTPWGLRLVPFALPRKSEAEGLRDKPFRLPYGFPFGS